MHERALFALGERARGQGWRTIADARAFFPGATLCRRIVPSGIVDQLTEARCVNADPERGGRLGRAIVSW
jgi:hypothetical protein